MRGGRSLARFLGRPSDPALLRRHHPFRDRAALDRDAVKVVEGVDAVPPRGRPSVGGEEGFEDGGGVVFGQDHRLPVDKEREFWVVGDRPIVHEPLRLYRRGLQPTAVVFHRISTEVRLFSGALWQSDDICPQEFGNSPNHRKIHMVDE